MNRPLGITLKVIQYHERYGLFTLTECKLTGNVASEAILKTRCEQALRITLKATEQTLCVNRRYWVASRKGVKFALKIFFAFTDGIEGYSDHIDLVLAIRRGRFRAT